MDIIKRRLQQTNKYQSSSLGAGSGEKKKYDVLDHRKAEFESDYEDFVVQVDNLQTSLQLFMDSWFERSLNTEYLLELMEKFDNIAGAK